MIVERDEQADSLRKERDAYCNDLKWQRLNISDLEVELTKLRRGRVHQQLTRERDTAMREAKSAKISEEVAKTKLAEVLKTAQSSEEIAEKV